MALFGKKKNSASKKGNPPQISAEDLKKKVTALANRLYDAETDLFRLKLASGQRAPLPEAPPSPPQSDGREKSAASRHAVFVCHNKDLWQHLHPVFSALVASEQIQVSVVIVPDKDNAIQDDLSGFFSQFSCHVIDGYDVLKNTYINIRALLPDYIFFQSKYAERLFIGQKIVADTTCARIKCSY